MKINFILPENANRPVGGFKIVFQYANKLVDLGYDVSISFLNNLYPERTNKLKVKLARSVKKLLGINSQSRRITWFNLDPRVKLFYNIIGENELPVSDVVIATAVQTAKFLSNVDSRFGRKYYFIQNYETWAYPKEEVNDTFRLPFQKIVIAQWLYDIVVRETNDNVFLVPNFLNKKVYYLANDIRKRKNDIAILYHTLPEKNVQFGMDVLDKVKGVIPDLHVRMFGIFEKPGNLPKYYTYYKQPSQNQLRDEIYGKSKIYILPSLLEGWCLTGMEAMASGSVLIASDIGGVADYTQNNRNAILVKPNDLELFVSSIIDVLKNDKRQIRIANQGVNDIKKFNIDTSTKMLLNVLKNEK